MPCGETRKKNAGSIKNPGGYGYLSRTYFPHPEPAGERGKTEHQDAQGKRKRHLSDGPSKSFGKRNTEYTPRVHRTERNLHDHAGHRYTPPIRQGCFFCRSRTIRRSHKTYPHFEQFLL